MSVGQLYNSERIRSVRPVVRSAQPKVDGRGAPMRVVHLAVEYWPLAFTGGLGAAVSGLSRAAVAKGQDTTVFVPLYQSVVEGGVSLAPLGEAYSVRLGTRCEEARLWRLQGTVSGLEVIFLQHDGFFMRDGVYGDGLGEYADNARRFAFFTLAALTALPRITPVPAVLHAHDWHTALAPVYLRTMFAGADYYDAIPTVLSVHNAAHQGQFPTAVAAEIGLPEHVDGGHTAEGLNWLKLGLTYTDVVSTVSPNHAHELRSSRGGFGLHQTFAELGDRFVGVLNGIDPEYWDPASDPHIAARYSTADLTGKSRCKAALQQAYGLRDQSGTPLLAMCARLARQKGLDLVINVLRSLPEAQFVFLGQGERHYAQALVELARTAPDRFGVHIGFSDALEHQLLAGADLLLMPSLYEPCGLTQMRAQRYGTVPVARRVGGLADTVEDGVTGFLFDDYSTEGLQRSLRRAFERYHDRQAWTGLCLHGMRRGFGWDDTIVQYTSMYHQALQVARRRRGLPRGRERSYGL